MPTDELDLIRSLRSAVEESTTDLHYTGPVPSVRTETRKGPAMALAVVAVAAVAVIGAQLAPDGGDGRAPASDPSPSETDGGRWVANSGPALKDVITDHERTRPASANSSADLCLLPAGHAGTSCSSDLEAPYPLLIQFDADVPSGAQRFPALDGFEGEALRGWIADDASLGGVVWLSYADTTLRISAGFYETGAELARYLLDHPAKP